jgi:hypothetical protein
MMIAHKCDGSKEPHASTEESRGRKTNRSKIVRLTGRVTHSCEIEIMHDLKIFKVEVETRLAIVNP